MMTTTGNNPSTADSADELKEKIETYLRGKAYIAVLKHHLGTGKTSARRLKEVFDEAYHEAATLLPHDDTSEPPPPKEKIQTYVIGKAYIAVLKHQLANGTTSGSRLKDVFDQAYREAAALARCEPPEPFDVARAKPPSS
jgi:hypothetical protein